MKKLQNMASWQTLVAKNPAVFPSPSARNVKLTVMAVEKTIITIKLGTGKEPHVVKVPVDGLETVSFSVSGAYTLEADKDLQLYNCEWAEVGFDGTGETYTSVMVRQSRSPELEAIEQRLFQNQQVRLAQMAADSRRQVEAIKADADNRVAAAEAAASDNSTGGAGDDAAKSSAQGDGAAVTASEAVATGAESADQAGGASDGPVAEGG